MGVRMVELSSEEETALRELVDARTGPDSVKDFISHRLYDELSRLDGRDDLGEERRTYFDGYEEQSQMYRSLVAKGMLEASRPSPAVYWYGDLTPEGRCYFADRDAMERRRADEVRAQRLHDYKVALFSFLGGAVSGGMVTLVLHFCLGL